MDVITISLRVTAPDRDVARVSTGRRQFAIGRPLEFDEASSRVAAIEYALGAIGGEVVNGLRVFADRRRLPLEAVEATISGELINGLTYLELAVSLINRVVAGSRHLRIGVHICRGNWSRDEATLLSGGYQPPRSDLPQPRLRVRRLFEPTCEYRGDRRREDEGDGHRGT